VALLAAMSAGFQNRHTFNASFEQGILDCVQLGGLENGFNFDHTQIASFDSVTGEGAGCATPPAFLTNLSALQFYDAKS
jgi:hypothetical protein